MILPGYVARWRNMHPRRGGRICVARISATAGISSACGYCRARAGQWKWVCLMLPRTPATKCGAPDRQPGQAPSIEEMHAPKPLCADGAVFMMGDEKRLAGLICKRLYRRRHNGNARFDRAAMRDRPFRSNCCWSMAKKGARIAAVCGQRR